MLLYLKLLWRRFRKQDISPAAIFLPLIIVIGLSSVLFYAVFIEPRASECLDNMQHEVAMLRDRYPETVVCEENKAVLGSTDLVPNIMQTFVNEKPVYQVLLDYEDFFADRGYEIERYSGYTPGFYARRDYIKVDVHLTGAKLPNIHEDNGNVYELHLSCGSAFARVCMTLDNIIN